MDDDLRRELDELRRRVEQLELALARLVGGVPAETLPSERNPLDHPQPPRPGDYPG